MKHHKEKCMKMEVDGGLLLVCICFCQWMWLTCRCRSLALVTSKRSNLFTHRIAVIVILMCHHLPARGGREWVHWSQNSRWVVDIQLQKMAMCAAGGGWMKTRATTRKLLGPAVCVALVALWGARPPPFIVSDDPPHDANRCSTLTGHKHDRQQSDAPPPAYPWTTETIWKNVKTSTAMSEAIWRQYACRYNTPKRRIPLRQILSYRDKQNFLKWRFDPGTMLKSELRNFERNTRTLMIIILCVKHVSDIDCQFTNTVD